jgi:hypothetical protein
MCSKRVYLICVLLVLGSAVTGLAAELAHRWSFNGHLKDSVAGQDAVVVDLGANDAIMSENELTLTGGSKGSSDYIDLPDNILSGLGDAVTIECWATQLSVQNWSRIFDFGTSTSEYLYMGWSVGTDINNDRVEWNGPAGGKLVDGSNAPYTLGTEYHMVMVIEPGLVTWYTAPADAAELGPAKGSFETGNAVSTLNHNNAWIGRSQWGDNTANASYNEFRIWKGAMTATEIAESHAAGPIAATQAWNPSPADGATSVFPRDLVVTWTPTADAVAFNVYGGEDPSALQPFAEGQAETSFSVGNLIGDLELSTVYYWRVDQVLADGAVTEGIVWSFTTDDGNPVITSIQGDAVALGGDAQLVCEASSAVSPELSYQWYRETVIMMGFELHDVPLPEGVEATLNISGVTADDQGYYYCVVTNENGSVTSAMAFLDVQTGLIHRWTFDESADGVTIPDVVGGADATLMSGTGNATIAGGQATLGNTGSQNSNNAAAGDYIDLPNGLISPLTQMTIECWTTWDGTDAVWQRIYDMGTANGGEDVSNGGDQVTYFYVTPDSGSRSLLLEYRRLGAQYNMPMVDSGKMTAGQEVLITQVHDDVTGIIKLYINGTILGAYKAPVMLNEFIDNNLWLGRSQWGDPLYCGSYNELRIYDTALSAAEIAASYLAGPDVVAEPAVPCEVHVVGDRNGDCVVDFIDAAVTADEWLVQSLAD